MYKNLFLFLVMLFALKANSQILYWEDFDGIGGPTSGGPGTYTFPPDMLLRNVDNLTPASNVTYVNNAWIRKNNSYLGTYYWIDTCAISNSSYTPVGVANDFMWTPMISIPAFGTATLSWKAAVVDATFPDGYEVRIMTVAPTGGTGDIGNQISNSTVLFSINAENYNQFGWNNRNVDISAYAGQSVYIGFRNNSNDQFLLLIDDIKVERSATYDASVTAGFSSEYRVIPSGQSPIPLEGAITNMGSGALTNVALKADIYNSLNVLVHSVTSTPVATIIPNANVTFTMPSYTPTVADLYTIKYNHVQTEVDPVTANDELIRYMEFSNNLFARDNGIVTSSFGIGAGNGGYIGQAFTLTNPAYLYSIGTYYAAGYLANEKYGSAIWNTDVTGKPTTLLAVTDTNIYPNQNPLFATSPIHGGTILIPAGTYVVTAIEFDSTLKLGQTDEIFTLGKHWVKWPTIPGGDWTNVETFGAPYQKAMTIRMNVGSTAIPLPTEALILKGTSLDKQHQLSWTNPEKADNRYEYILQMSEDTKNWKDVYTESALGKDAIRSLRFNDSKGVSEKSYYRVRVMNQDNELKYSNMVSLFNSDTEV